MGQMVFLYHQTHTSSREVICILLTLSSPSAATCKLWIPVLSPSIYGPIDNYYKREKPQSKTYIMDLKLS